MAKEGRHDYCTTCRRMTDYHLTRIPVTEVFHGTEYTFLLTAAVCEECRQAMNIPGLIDLNIQERDRQFRRKTDLISAEEIRKLLELSHMKEEALSAALGMEKEALSGYLQGQIPSRAHSDLMKRALRDLPSICSP